MYDLTCNWPRMDSDPHIEIGCVLAQCPLEILSEHAQSRQTVAGKAYHDDSVIYLCLGNPSYGNIAVQMAKMN